MIHIKNAWAIISEVADISFSAKKTTKVFIAKYPKIAMWAWQGRKKNSLFSGRALTCPCFVRYRPAGNTFQLALFLTVLYHTNEIHAKAERCGNTPQSTQGQEVKLLLATLAF